METEALTDSAIEKEIGIRIKALRLRKNMTQAQLAKAACIHRNAVSAMETGKGSRLSTVIAVLRELKALNQLDSFIPPITISPLQLVKSKGKERKRASGTRGEATRHTAIW